MGFLRRRVGDPLLGLLKQGLTPEKLAASVAVGVGLSIFPVVGVTTLLCALVAWLFGLNQPAVQLINYLAYPLQFLLLIPFIRLGERLFSATPLPFNVVQIATAMRADFWSTLRMLWSSTWHAVMAWGLIVPPLAAILGWALVPLFRSIRGRHSA